MSKSLYYLRLIKKEEIKKTTTTSTYIRIAFAILSFDIGMCGASYLFRKNSFVNNICRKSDAIISFNTCHAICFTFFLVVYINPDLACAICVWMDLVRYNYAYESAKYQTFLNEYDERM